MALPHEVISPVVKKWSRTEVAVKKLSYTWTIANFSCCPQLCGEALQSETFSIETNTEKSEWCLKVYPKREGYYMVIELHLISSSKRETKVRFKFSVLNGTTNRSIVHTFRPGTTHRSSFVRYKELEEMDSFIEDDKLTIVCDLGIVGDTVHSSGQSDFKTPECTLSKDYSLLFENEKFSDVTLCVRGHEFRVHKTVLVARSPVFQAMFEHKMSETKNNRVDITDIDHVVMKELLRFMYTGKVSDNILKEMVSDLFTAADKYELEGLKLMCEQTLSTKVSVDNVVKTLILADLHGLTQLKSYAINFINGHMAAVMETGEWEYMRETRPELIAEAYCALAPEKRTGEDLSKQLTKKIKINP